MTDPLEQITVLRQHLEEVYDALNWCETYFGALGVADAAKERLGTPAGSNRLAASITQAKDHMEGYLISDGVQSE